MPLSPITASHAVGGVLVRFDRYSAPVPVLTVPGAPSAVTASSVTASSVTLSWGAPANTGGSPITGYVVSRDGAGGTSTTLGAAARSQQFRSLAASTTYHLSVAAINAVGTGPAITVTVTTPAGTQPSGGQRFPGDPQPLKNNGTLYLGMSTGSGQSITPFDAAKPVAVYHQYWSNVSDLSVPSGPMAKAVQADHTAGRLPLVSWHVPAANWAGGAAGAYDSLIDAWISWCEGLAKPVFWVVNHEPENDGGTAANYCAWMQHVRSRITVWEQAHGPRKRLTFLMCLVAATFAGNRGGMAAWWPGDGVVDVVGVDHYGDGNNPNYQAGDTFFTGIWSKFLAYVQGKNMPWFLCEFNWLPDNPNGAAEYQQMFSLYTNGSYDCVGMSLFDSGWWVLTDNNGMLSQHKALLASPKAVRLSDLGY